MARALYANADILVFDEATSALDTITEKALIDEIKRLAGKKTMIVVTHRLSTIKFCDKIIMLDNGRIIGHGKYHDLEKIIILLGHLFLALQIQILTQNKMLM